MASVRADQATAELQEVTKLLQLIFHRNKNQHHSTKWWKWLSILKRCLLALPHENADAAKARRSYMSEFLIPRCHRAFTNLVADQQFAALGLVLLANLARVARIVGAMAGKGPRRPGKDARRRRVALDGDEDLGESVARSDLRDAALSPQSLPLPQLETEYATTGDGDGPKVEKVDPSDAPGMSGPLTDSRTSSAKPRKRRREKANAIDELFNGLA